MWIKNHIDKNNSNFIIIENINLRNMVASSIKILLINDHNNKFL